MRRIEWRAMAALALLVWAAGTARADGRTMAFNMKQVPDVYGPGILFAWSGLEADTHFRDQLVASTSPGSAGLVFHLAGQPSLRVYFPSLDADAIRYRLVSSDLIVADVKGDSEPLVIGVAEEHLIVGRLPAGGRVSEGGRSPNTALLRRPVGARTVFAFAYDPEGARNAADRASLGLTTSFDSLVESRTNFFKQVPDMPFDTDPRLAKVLAKATSVLKVNTYSAERPIRGRWTTPARWPVREMWLWGSALDALGLRHMSANLGKEVLLALTEFQDREGFIPGRVSPPATLSDTAQPPLLGWSAWEVFKYDKRRDRRFLDKMFEASRRNAIWLMKKRRLDGEPPPEKAIEYGSPLYKWASAEESGMGNSPRFDNGTEFAAVDLSAYLYNECRTLQEMAQALGYRELAKTWGARADAIGEATRSVLWDPDRQFFFDRAGPDGPRSETWTSAGFLPLWAGLATKEQAAAMVRHLRNPEKFWASMPVPSVALDDPKYQPDAWRGPAWVNVNYLVIRGLERYGYKAEAELLRRRTLYGLTRWYERTGCLYEFYDPADETPPSDLQRGVGGSAVAGAVPDFNWSAALFMDLLLSSEDVLRRE